MRFNQLLENHFAGCPVILTINDECRGRTIRVHYLKNYPEHAGMCDGTDAWIISVIVRPEVKRIVDAIHAGEFVPEEARQRQRVRVASLNQPATPTRKERHRVIQTSDSPNPRQEAHQGRLRTRIQRAD